MRMHPADADLTPLLADIAGPLLKVNYQSTINHQPPVNHHQPSHVINSVSSKRDIPNQPPTHKTQGGKLEPLELVTSVAVQSMRALVTTVEVHGDDWCNGWASSMAMKLPMCQTFLVGGDWNMAFYFPIQLGSSSSQLTNSNLFQRGLFNHQPYP